MGVRLRWLESDALTWRDLYVIVRNLPQSSALHRSVNGVEESMWTLSDYLLAQIADTTAWLAWTKTKDAEKGRNQPKPLPRPGAVDESKKQIGSGTLPADEMLDWLGWKAPDDISELDIIEPFIDKPRTKLDPSKVRAIRSSNRARAELAAEFAVSVSTISDVICGRTWKHVTE